MEAAYGPTEQEEALHELATDVTVPLQALVRNSQLHIPSGRSKVRHVFIKSDVRAACGALLGVGCIDLTPFIY